MNRRQQSPSSGHRRTEPVLGDLDQIDAPGPREADARPDRRASQAPPFAEGEPADAPRRRPRRRRRRWTGFLVVVLLIVAGGWVWTNQAMLRSWLPQTRLNALLTHADKALAAGNLVGNADSARGLYAAARALDPDNGQAIRGLRNVGKAELARARQALHKGQYSAARGALEQARSLLGGGAEVTAVDKALSKAVLHSANVDVLISQARAALANGQITGSGGAAALFGKVLAGDPHNAVARHGMNQIGDLLAKRIQAQLKQGDRAGAKKVVQQLAKLLPGYAQLPDLRAAIAKADRAALAQRKQALDAGEADLRAGKLAGNGDDNAVARFKAVLAADPDNAKAKAGLAKVAAALIVKANAALDMGQRKSARGMLDQAAALAPTAAGLAAARLRLEAANSASGKTAPATASSLSPTESAKVAQLVARADAAARKGQIMLPPGASAFDLYRAALAIDADDAQAQAGLHALPGITRDRFRRAVREGNLDHAQDMLATMQQLAPSAQVVGSMRRQLGNAWLDRAAHAAAAGHAPAARTALEQARALVPHDPRIATVGARLHTKPGAAD